MFVKNINLARFQKVIRNNFVFLKPSNDFNCLKQLITIKYKTGKPRKVVFSLILKTWGRKVLIVGC
jgi:hypothetical protein